MAASYKLVQWNRFKRVYDLVLLAGLVVFLAVYLGVASLSQPAPSPPILLIRALGSAGFVLLTLILSIGPLARLDSRFLPLLYNRRHLGVVAFLVLLLHGVLSLGWYHGFGPISPLQSLFTSNPLYGDLIGFPFQVLGFAALLILFVMAATSHDFWLKRLSPVVWKALHMAVYVAYTLVLAHILLGPAQSPGGLGYGIMALASGITVTLLHLSTGLTHMLTGPRAAKSVEGWIDAGKVAGIADGRARRVAMPDGAEVALFRIGDKLSAVAGACAHQGGPLAEGKIIDGCITCPWHGYQYDPVTGRSPPPFTERIATYQVRVRDGRAFVNPVALPPGTPIAPATVEAT